MTTIYQLDEYRSSQTQTGSSATPTKTRLDEIDRYVIGAAVDGDEDACLKIVSAFQGPIYGVIFRMVGGRYPNDIEDFTQDLFLKVFAALDRFDPDRGIKFSTWVFTFVKNYCIDILKRRRRPVISFDDREDDERKLEPEGGELGPPQMVIGGELGECIGLAVDALPEDQKLVFLLRECRGLDYRTIGNMTGYAPGTVRSRLYRAKDALRSRLGSYVRADAL